MKNLKNKKVLVTGGARGIGKQIAIEFAQQGGVQLNPQERIELKAFLLTLSDVEFINNPNFSDPH